MKKESKMTKEEIFAQLPDFMNENIVLNVLINLDKKKQQELLDQANQMKNEMKNRKTARHLRKIR
jgi:hypothetical protein